MPIFSDQRVDTHGVEVRRRAGPAAVGGGLGVTGLLVYLLITLLGW